MLDTTIRAEWEAGHGPDQLPADADRGGLADAAWHNRARTASPAAATSEAADYRATPTERAAHNQ